MSTNQNTRPDSDPKKKVINSTWALVVAFLFVGPFCLPLLWRNPRFTRTEKWIWTGVITGVTLVFVFVSGGVVRETYRQMQQVMQLYNNQQ